MTMVQVMSLEQPANGWFIPYCQDQTLFFADEAIEQRKNVKIPLFVTGEESNVLNVASFYPHPVEKQTQTFEED